MSPQRWSGSSKDLTGTGELTIDGTTLLFWNGRKSSRLSHHPELGIPIMTFNDGYTKSAAFLSTCSSSLFCFPCTEEMSYIHTSQPLNHQMNENVVHIIPLEDEEMDFRHIGSTCKNILVDELDKKNSQLHMIEEFD